MNETAINIQLDEKTAEAYQRVSADKREQLRMLIGLFVQEFAQYSPQSLLKMMDEMSREAQANGLTPEILDSLLSDE